MNNQLVVYPESFPIQTIEVVHNIGSWTDRRAESDAYEFIMQSGQVGSKRVIKRVHSQ